MSYDEFRALEPSTAKNTLFGLSDSFIPLFPEDRQRETRRYMPPIEMFASAVAAELFFSDNRLTSVEAVFDPVEPSQSRTVVASIESALKAEGDLVGREESEDVKGAYTLRFVHSNVVRSIWVNLAQPDRPIVRLRVWRSTAQDDRKRAVETRQKKAFGSK